MAVMRVRAAILSQQTEQEDDTVILASIQESGKGTSELG